MWRIILGNDAVALSKVFDATRELVDEFHDFIVGQAPEKATLPQFIDIESFRWIGCPTRFSSFFSRKNSL
jgi:hypothetical protein